VEFAMPDRRFLIASSFARLIERQCGTQNDVVEGYFPPRPGRRQVVRIEAATAYLTLTSTPREGPPVEERVEVPKGHAEALLDVTSGVIGFSRTDVALAGGGEAVLDRFSRPGRLDTMTVSFADAEAAAAFEAPVWFGPEITDNALYEPGALSFDGIPDDSDVTPTNTALEALIDGLEDGRNAAPEPAMAETDGGEAREAVDDTPAEPDEAVEAEHDLAEAAERTNGVEDGTPAKTAAPTIRVEVDRARDRVPGIVSDLARMLPTRRVG
jgi:CYTH domain-containing protein